jgi:hypothetical protein
MLDSCASGGNWSCWRDFSLLLRHIDEGQPCTLITLGELSRFTTFTGTSRLFWLLSDAFSSGTYSSPSKSYMKERRGWMRGFLLTLWISFWHWSNVIRIPFCWQIPNVNWSVNDSFSQNATCHARQWPNPRKICCGRFPCVVIVCNLFGIGVQPIPLIFAHLSILHHAGIDIFWRSSVSLSTVV